MKSVATPIPSAWRARLEGGLSGLCWIAVAVSVLTTLGIVSVLLLESGHFFSQVPISRFLSETEWTPLHSDQRYGIRALLNGTLMIALGSSLIALPMGLAVAIYLSEYASLRVRNLVKPALELLAGVPSVVYGYLGLTVVTPFLQSLNPAFKTYNALSGAVVVGIMILPLVATLSEDAIRSVPKALREGAYGLGATRAEVSTTVVLRAAAGGIAAGFILAISRAVGETMAVTLAAGQRPTAAFDFTESIGTMTAYFVQVSQGDIPRSGPQYTSIFAVGLTLFAITYVMNVASRRIVARLRRHEA